MWNGSSQVATWQATIASETTVRAARRISDRLDRSGLATLARYGREHFSEIGRLGDLSTVSRHRGQLSAWGKRGGRPRKASLADMRESRSASWIEVIGKPAPDFCLPRHSTSDHLRRRVR